MKILIIHCAYQYMGGESTVVQEEMRLLQELGNRTRLLQFSNTQNELLKLLQLPFNLSSYLKTLRTVRQFQPDVVHIHNLHFGASASVIYAVKKENIPLVLTLHNFRLLCPSGTLFFKGKLFLDSLRQGFYWSAITKGAYKNSRMITLWLSLSMQLHKWLNTWKIPRKYIVLSQHAKELFLTSRLGIKDQQITIKPNFTTQPILGTEVRGDHFLFIGRLSKEKGIELLLETFASQPSYLLQIAGDGPHLEQTISFAKKYPNISYLGVLDKSMVQSSLQRCSALLFPSIWFEGMPLTIIEAFSCGTPVIASKLGAMQHMITHGYNGLHFKPNNTTDLTMQLAQWVRYSKQEKTAFEQHAFSTFRQEYTPGKNASQLVAIYEDAIAIKPHGN